MAARDSDLIKWAESLSAIARTGLAFTESLYEQERFEEILRVAAEIRISSSFSGEGFSVDELDADELFEIYRSQVGRGVSGYVTPKCAVAAVVKNDDDEILLVQRSDSGVWLYPTGWADVGYSASEVVVKEVAEETGIEVEPIKLIGVLDGMRRGFTAIPMYSLVFLCKVLGGSLKAHPLEVTDVGWFSRDNLPKPMPSLERWIPEIYRALDGEDVHAYFDLPRKQP